MRVKRFLSLAAILFLIPCGAARAQTCDAVYETITTLRPPIFGFPAVWDAKYGGDGMVQLASGVPQEAGTVFALGRRLSDKDFKPQDIILIELNRRGRALTEASHPAKDGEEPIKMIPLESGFIALSAMQGGKGHTEKWARLSWYGKDGSFKKDLIIKDGTYNYESMTLVPSVEQSGFVVVLHAVNRADTSDRNGVLARYSPQGTLLWRRAYRPGIPNMLTNLVAIDGENYLATGQIRMDDGRMAAWALNLGYDGAVRWQRTWPRGKSSVLRHAVQIPGRTADGQGFILSGDSDPYDGGPRSAFVMAIDALGEPQWQRYYRRKDYELTGNWLMSQPDGRAVLIMNAKAAPDGGGHDHVRMLTLSPRGVMLGDESYHEGLMARGTDFAVGPNGERVMTAITEIDTAAKGDVESPVVVVGLGAQDAPPEEAKAPPQKSVQMGWVFMATPLDPYDDPCIGYGRR